MELFVLRHGQAEPQETTDDARNLTAKGRADVAANIRASMDDLKGVQEIWASPLVRAQQTAAIVQGLLAAEGINVSIKTTDLIIPEAFPRQAIDFFQALPATSVLIASHMPFVGELLDYCCGAEAGFHNMHTSSLACVDFELVAAGLGDLRWLRHVHD